MEIKDLKEVLRQTEELAAEIRGKIAALEAETEKERFKRISDELKESFKERLTSK